MRPFELAGLETHGDIERWAVLSPDGRYRYALGVLWDLPVGGFDGRRPILDITMLNPSKADHRENDLTFLKVCHFARQEGCGGVLLRNLAAFRATNPKELETASDIIGPRNEEVLSLRLDRVIPVAAWGKLSKIASARTLGTQAIAKSRCTHVLGLTKDGAPLHPCRLPNATRVVSLADAWAARRAA